MAREAKLIDPSQGAVWYKPAVFGNRDSPKPIKVLLRRLTAAEYQLISARAVQEMSKLVAKAGDNLDAILGKQVSDELLRAAVLGTENYTGRWPDGVVCTPKNGSELLEIIYGAGGEELALRDDIADALRDSSALEAGLEKKSDTPSDSSAPRTASPLESGPAPSVDNLTRETPTSPPQLS